MDGRGLEIPEHGRLIDEETVAFAAALIDRSGTAGQAEAALARPAGRRRALPVRAVLAALLILAMDDRPLHLTLVTDLLFRRLSGASRRLLGVSGAAPAGRRASWPPTAGSATATTRSARQPTPRHCRKTGASPGRNSRQPHGR